MAQLTVADDEIQLAALAAERVTQLVSEAVRAQGAVLVALTGGTTPKRLYSNLADPSQPWRDRIPWAQVHVFWGDERHVPPAHPDSNYGMARAALLDHIPIPADHVHRIHGELSDAREAALDYDRELNGVASARRKNLFDLMLLGLGDDGHIASIFPGSELLGRESTHRVAAVWARHLGDWRITLTPEALLDTGKIVVLVSGNRKADAVRAALEAPLETKVYPAHVLRIAEARVEWFVDRAAASRL